MKYSPGDSDAEAADEDDDEANSVLFGEADEGVVDSAVMQRST